MEQCRHQQQGILQTIQPGERSRWHHQPQPAACPTTHPPTWITGSSSAATASGPSIAASWCTLSASATRTLAYSEADRASTAPLRAGPHAGVGRAQICRLAVDAQAALQAARKLRAVHAGVATSLHTGRPPLGGGARRRERPPEVRPALRAQVAQHSGQVVRARLGQGGRPRGCIHKRLHQGCTWGEGSAGRRGTPLHAA